MEQETAQALLSAAQAALGFLIPLQGLWRSTQAAAVAMLERIREPLVLAVQVLAAVLERMRVALVLALVALVSSIQAQAAALVGALVQILAALEALVVQAMSLSF